jgi:hypothetical protein
MDAGVESSKNEKKDDGQKSAEERVKIRQGLETKIKEEIDAEHHPNTSLVSRECEQIFVKEEATEQELPRKILLEKNGDNCRVFIKEEAQDENAALSREEDDPLTRQVNYHCHLFS